MLSGVLVESESNATIQINKWICEYACMWLVTICFNCYKSLFSYMFQALAPALRREHPGSNIDLHEFFVSRVKSNLHVILCLPPSHRLLEIAATYVYIFA